MRLKQAKLSGGLNWASLFICKNNLLFQIFHFFITGMSISESMHVAVWIHFHPPVFRKHKYKSEIQFKLVLEKKRIKIPWVLLSTSVSPSCLISLLALFYLSVSLPFMQISVLHYSYFFLFFAREACAQRLILVCQKTLYCKAPACVLKEQSGCIYDSPPTSCLPFVPPLITLWTSSRGAPAAAEPLRRPAGEPGWRHSGPLQRRQNWIDLTHIHTPLIPSSLSLSLSPSSHHLWSVKRVRECEKPPWRSHQGSNQCVNTKCTLLLRCDDGGEKSRWESLSGAKISAYANWTKDLNWFDVHKSISDPFFRDVVTGSQEKNMCRLAY